MHKFEGAICPDTPVLQGYFWLGGGGGFPVSLYEKASSPCFVSPNQGASSTKHCGFMQISDILVFKWNDGLWKGI